MVDEGRQVGSVSRVGTVVGEEIYPVLQLNGCLIQPVRREPCSCGGVFLRARYKQCEHGSGEGHRRFVVLSEANDCKRRADLHQVVDLAAPLGCQGEGCWEWGSRVSWAKEDRRGQLNVRLELVPL